jgi:hypothetical protein
LFNDSSIVSNLAVTSVKVGSGGMQSSSIEVHGNAPSIQILGDLVAGTITSTGTLSSLKVVGDASFDSSIEAQSFAKVAINGALSDSSLTSHGTSGAIKVGGLSGGAGAIVMESDVAAITVAGPVTGESAAKMHIGGTAASIIVNGSVFDCTLDFNAVTSLKVAKSLVACDIIASGHLGSIAVAGGVANVFIGAHAGLSSLSVKGLVASSDVEVTGDLGNVAAAGLASATFAATGNVGAFAIGPFGMDSVSLIDAAGDFAGLKTPGLIFGRVDVGGDLTGSVLTAGSNAALYHGSYALLDANGQPTGGSLRLAGTASPSVIVS